MQRPATPTLAAIANKSTASEQSGANKNDPVSYTHLTLPTILRV